MKYPAYHKRSSEKLDHFKKVQVETARSLKQIEDEGCLVGFSDLGLLRDLVDMAELISFKNNGKARNPKSNDVMTPRVIMAEPSDPPVHMFKVGGMRFAVDRSQLLYDETHNGFFVTYTIGSLVLPTVITVKDRPIEAQVGTFAHELTHWLDTLVHTETSLNNTLTEKRAHFVGHHVNRIMGSPHYMPSEEAVIVEGDDIFIPYQSISAGLVGVSQRYGSEDLNRMSADEVHIYNQVIGMETPVRDYSL